MRNFFKRYRTLLIILLIAIVGIGAFLSTRSVNADAGTEFQTTDITRGNLTATIGATGTVRAQQSATLLWQVAGTVESINVKVGEIVRAEEVLAELASVAEKPGIVLHHIPIYDYQDIGLGDFDATEAMFKIGAEAMRAYLAASSLSTRQAAAQLPRRHAASFEDSDPLNGPSERDGRIAAGVTTPRPACGARSG